MLPPRPPRHELLIIGILLENPSKYLREICSVIKEATRVIVSGPTVCRIIKGNGFSRKKLQYVAKQQRMEYRAEFMARALFYSSDLFVWVDEMGSDNRKSMRRFGYSFKGIAPVHHRFLVRGKRISAIAVVCSDGLLGVELVMDSVNGDNFADFVRGTLIPNMHPYDGTSSKCIVVLDNCSVHHVPEVITLLEDARLLVLFLPPYSPDLNPI